MGTVIKPGDNIQQAINAGDVTFSPGTYPVSSPLSVPQNRELKGLGAVLNWTGSNGNLMVVAGSGVTVSGLVFDGAGVYASHVRELNLVKCGFQNLRSAGWTKDVAFFFDSISNSDVTGNTFSNWHGGSGCVFGYNPEQCHFDDNKFDGLMEGMHINWPPAILLSNTTFLRNVFLHFTRFAMEFQGAADGLDIGNNYAEYPVPANHATLIYSLPLVGEPNGGGPISLSRNIHVHHNYAGGAGLVPGPVANHDQSWAWELGGADTNFHDNIANGAFLHGIVFNRTTPAGQVRTSIFAGIKDSVFSTENQGQLPASGNMSGNQVLPSPIAIPTPQSITSGSYWNGGTPTPTPTPIPPPDATIKGTANPDGTVTATWTGPGPLSIRANDPGDVRKFPQAKSPATIGNLNDGWGVWLSDGTTETPKIMVVNGALSASVPFDPELVTTPTPAPTPTLMRTTQFFDDGTYKDVMPKE